MEVVGRGRLNTYRYTVTIFCLKMGSDERSYTTVSTNHNLFEEKGEPKRYPTGVLPLTSLTPYR